MLSLFKGTLLVFLAGACGWGAGRMVRRAGVMEKAVSPAARAETANVTARQRTIAATPEGGWMERVRRAPPAELAALWEEARTLFELNGNTGREARLWLLTRWAALDWDGAVAFCQEKSGETNHTLQLEVLALPGLLGEALALTDPRRTMEMLNSGEANVIRGEPNFRKAAAEVLSKGHPALFFQIGGVREADERTESRERKIALEKLAAADPAAAREILKDCLTHAGRLKKQWLTAFLTGLSARGTRRRRRAGWSGRRMKNCEKREVRRCWRCGRSVIRWRLCGRRETARRRDRRRD